MPTKMKSIALLSGGLDSTLVIGIMLKEGIEVEAINFITPFCKCSKKGCPRQAKRVAERFGIPLKVINIFKEYMEVVKKPKYGYGSGINPCIDCRILMFKKAKEYMIKTGASFIVTGEVLGQRPMSQHLQAMKIIEQESGLERLVLRPLSAKLLEETLPEEKAWVNREHLLNLFGRSRKPQMALAKDLQINDYPCPAGGCLLTDKIFATRMKDLLNFNQQPSLNDIELLKIGRHFRLSEALKVIVGRNEDENKKLLNLLKDGDVKLVVGNYKGPIVICRGIINQGYLLKAAAICARYSDDKGKSRIKVSWDSQKEEMLSVSPIDEAELNKLRI